MKPTVAAKVVVSATCSLFLAFGAAAQSTDAPPPASPAAQKVSVKGVARFGFDRATVNPEDGGKLMSEVRSMKNVTWQTIRVTGHTDSLGPVPYNEKLSERRAEAVQAFLIEKGVKPERIKTDGKGPHVPVASNKTASGRAVNRRAEIEFVGLQSLAQNLR
jgi:OOP family OmpA-OmpF porin